MKAGYINTISEATFSGGSNPTYSRENDSLKVTTLNAGATLTITPASGILVDFVAIFNYSGTNLEVKTTQTSAGVTTTNLTDADATGLQYNNYLVSVADNTDTVTVITIKNTGGAAANLGYVYAGLWIDFGCLEALQPFDESTDDVTIERANKPLYDPRYSVQTFNITTKKDRTYAAVRTDVRKILATGYALKRPFLFDEPFMDNEMVLGVFGSGRFGYDAIDLDGTGSTLTQFSQEIREVA